MKNLLILLLAASLFMTGCGVGTSAANEKAYDEIVIGDGLTGEGGMTIEEVKEIVGKNPKDHSTVDTSAGDIKMKVDMLTWVTGTNKGFSVTFTNGKATAKVEVGK